jgi:hypothetical protein
MRNVDWVTRWTAVLAFCAVTLAKAGVAAQAPPVGGRIAGRVIDRGGFALPGATVLLTSDAVTRSTTTDGEGRFVFDALGPGDSYIVRAELTGFEAAPQTGVVVRRGETTQVEIILKVGCLESSIVHHGASPAFDVLLQSDAIFHVRVVEDGHSRKLETGESCEIVSEAPITVLRTVSVSPVPVSPIAIARALSNDDALAAGSEYVVFHRHGRPADELFINQGFSFPVEGGRVMGVFEDRLGIANGVAVDQAIAGLQQTYKRHTRYRNYDDLTSAASFETLRFKTGWIAVGVLDSKLQKWTYERLFEIEAGSKDPRMLPRRGDRILLKESQAIDILDFGSRGEALRKRPPFTRHDGPDLADTTGTHASAHVPYTVADVQCERGDENVCIVWVRLIAK